MDTDLHIQNEIPPNILWSDWSVYDGKKVYDSEEEYVDVTDSDWYREIKAKTTPGDAMRIYRKNRRLTQAQLGEKLGDVSGSTVSELECGKESISLDIAKKLSAVFDVPPGRFLSSF